MKKCPYCAEKIQDDAIVCRYCSRDLPSKGRGHNTNRNISEKKSPWKIALPIGIGLSILIRCAVISTSEYINMTEVIMALIVNTIFYSLVIAGLIKLFRWIKQL